LSNRSKILKIVAQARRQDYRGDWLANQENIIEEIQDLVDTARAEGYEAATVEGLRWLGRKGSDE